MVSLYQQYCSTTISRMSQLNMDSSWIHMILALPIKWFMGTEFMILACWWLKVSHKIPKCNYECLDWVCRTHWSIVEVKETCGKIHEYLGMAIDYTQRFKSWITWLTCWINGKFVPEKDLDRTKVSRTGISIYSA